MMYCDMTFDKAVYPEIPVIFFTLKQLGAPNLRIVCIVFLALNFDHFSHIMVTSCHMTRMYMNIAMVSMPVLLTSVRFEGGTPHNLQ